MASEPMCLSCLCCTFETCGQECHLRGDVSVLEAENAPLAARVRALEEAGRAYIEAYDAALKAPLTPTVHHPPAEEYCHIQRHYVCPLCRWGTYIEDRALKAEKLARLAAEGRQGE